MLARLLVFNELNTSFDDFPKISEDSFKVVR